MLLFKITACPVTQIGDRWAASITERSCHLGGRYVNTWIVEAIPSLLFESMKDFFVNVLFD